MLEQELNKYLEWCRKHDLNAKNYKNFSLYLQAKTSAWWDDLETAIEYGVFSQQEMNAINDLRTI